MKMKAIEETCRAEQFSFIFNGPELHSHLHRFILEPWGIDYQKRIIKLVVYAPDMQVMGYITLRAPTAINEMLYAVKKKGYTEEAKAGTTVSTIAGLDKKGKELLKDDRYLQLKNQAIRHAYIMKKYNLSSSAAGKILALSEAEKALRGKD